MTLTARELAVLRRMRDEDEELVYSKGVGYVGLERVSRRILFSLLRAMAIRSDQYSDVGKFERYSINETGREILAKTEATQ